VYVQISGGGGGGGGGFKYGIMSFNASVRTEQWWVQEAALVAH
jgi:hypothetical protein